jgi:hypothetical protein
MQRTENNLFTKLRGRGHIGEVDIHVEILSKWIFEKEGVKVESGLKWLRIRFVGVFFRPWH